MIFSIKPQALVIGLLLLIKIREVSSYMSACGQDLSACFILSVLGKWRQCAVLQVAGYGVFIHSFTVYDGLNNEILPVLSEGISGCIYSHFLKLSHGRLARWIKWRACDVGEAKERLENELWRKGWGMSSAMTLTMSSVHSPNFPSLHLRYNSFSNPSVALRTSQIILQPFCCFTYVTVHSPTLLSLLLRHKFFT